VDSRCCVHMELMMLSCVNGGSSEGGCWGEESDD